MNSKKLTKIFYQDSGYNIQRNVVDLPLTNYVLQKKIGFLKILNHLYYKLRGSHPLLSNTHWELFKKNDGIWHFWNEVSFGKTPWVVTYETFVPRWPGISIKLKRKGVEALADDRCKKLIALSNCAKEFQIRYLQENFPASVDQIRKKITVIHPPQKLLVNSLEEKNLPSDKLIFTIVGSDFFRKGGKEILQVFDRLLSEKAPIELNIISTLDYGDYASKATKKDLNQAQFIINKYPNSIYHVERLPNNQVLDILKKSHIGLLPTYGDTYGYSVLEAQACGCPVITTNIRALPEVNNNKCGWVIKVPKNRWGNGRVDTSQKRSKFSNILEENLYKIISDIVCTPCQISKKGFSSIQRIKEEHVPEQVAHKTQEIYEEGLK